MIVDLHTHQFKVIECFFLLLFQYFFVSLLYFTSYLVYFLSTRQHLAAEGGRIKVVKHLVEQGADINMQDDNGVIICDHIHTSAEYLIGFHPYRRLQVQAYMGIARVISNHVYSYHEDWMRKHVVTSI